MCVSSCVYFPSQSSTDSLITATVFINQFGTYGSNDMGRDMDSDLICISNTTMTNGI